MTFKESIGKGLETILKKAVLPLGITALEVPLHEGLHAVTAAVLPGIESSGVALNSTHWYAKPFELLTFGYMKSVDMDPGLGGYALLSAHDGKLGQFSSALTSAMPEVATMTLGMFWISQSINGIRESGERFGSLVKAYCGYTLIASSHYYMSLPNSNPQSGDDYVNFTKSVIEFTGLPNGMADYVTVAGTALMMTSALYLANFFTNLLGKNDFRLK